MTLSQMAPFVTLDPTRHEPLLGRHVASEFFQPACVWFEHCPLCRAHTHLYLCLFQASRSRHTKMRFHKYTRYFFCCSVCFHLSAHNRLFLHLIVYWATHKCVRVDSLAEVLPLCICPKSHCTHAVLNQHALLELTSWCPAHSCSVGYNLREVKALDHLVYSSFVSHDFVAYTLVNFAMQSLIGACSSRKILVGGHWYTQQVVLEVKYPPAALWTSRILHCCLQRFTTGILGARCPMHCDERSKRSHVFCAVLIWYLGIESFQYLLRFSLVH